VDLRINQLTLKLVVELKCHHICEKVLLDLIEEEVLKESDVHSCGQDVELKDVWDEWGLERGRRKLAELRRFLEVVSLNFDEIKFS
jgi:hypothetical protein